MTVTGPYLNETLHEIPRRVRDQLNRWIYCHHSGCQRMTDEMVILGRDSMGRVFFEHGECGGVVCIQPAR